MRPSSGELRVSERSAFSLVELLVCMAISAVIAGVAGAMFLHGTAAGRQAAALGGRELAVAQLQLALRADCANSIVTGKAFEGDEGGFVCVVRDASMARRGTGVLRYLATDEGILREWQAFSGGDVARELYDCRGQFEYFGGEEEERWGGAWSSSNLPVAVRCVLGAEESVTAERFSGFSVKEEEP